jgi:MYXO-CTERM domain-containing protein
MHLVFVQRALVARHEDAQLAGRAAALVLAALVGLASLRTRRLRI